MQSQRRVWPERNQQNAKVGRGYQPRVPGPPLNGPFTQEVIQPP